MSMEFFLTDLLSKFSPTKHIPEGRGRTSMFLLDMGWFFPSAFARIITPGVKCEYRSRFPTNPMWNYPIDGSLLSRFPPSFPIPFIFSGFPHSGPATPRLPVREVERFRLLCWDCQQFQFNWTLLRWVIHHLPCDNNTCNYRSDCRGWNPRAIKGSSYHAKPHS